MVRSRPFCDKGDSAPKQSKAKREVFLEVRSILAPDTHARVQMQSFQGPSGYVFLLLNGGVSIALHLLWFS